MRTWKYVMAAALLPAMLWAGQISGQVTSLGAPIKNAKVMVYQANGATSVSQGGTGVKLDSATSDSTGAYSIAAGGNNPNTGSISFLVTLSGYHFSLVGSTGAVPTATTRNFVINRDDSSSVITGKVLKGSDSSIVIGASVVLTGGKIDGNKTVTTDSTGTYTFTKVGTATGYNVAVTSPGFTGASVGSVSVGWNSTTTIPNFFLTRNIGTLTGVVKRADTTTKTIAGAKIVLFVSGLKVDSTVSDGAGNYTIQVNAASYTVSASLAGYRGYKGTKTLDTTAVVNFGTSTVLNIFLTPATGTLFGIVSHTAVTNPPIAAGVVDSAKVYLERRRGTGAAYATWILTDSTTTDATGYYEFPGLIPATGGATPPVLGTSYNNPAGQYRVLAVGTKTAAGGVTWGQNWTGTDKITSATPNTFYTIAFAAGSTVTASFNLTGVVPPAAIFFAGSNSVKQMTMTLAGNQLSLNLGFSIAARTVQVFDINGSLKHTAFVNGGESKAVMPATFAKGYLFQVK